MMIHDNNLREERSAYFAPLSSYELAVNEQIELVWTSRVENAPIHKERFSDIERALARATSLAPRCIVVVIAKSLQGDSVDTTGDSRPLAAWFADGSGSIEDRIDGFVEFESMLDGCAGAEFRYYPRYSANRYYYPERGWEPSPSVRARGPFIESHCDEED